MEYTLVFNHRSYDLPKYTNAVRKKMDKINEQNNDERIDDGKKYESMYSFIKEMIGAQNALEIFESDNIDEIDLNHIAIAYLGIAIGYEKPRRDVEREARMPNDEDIKMAMSVLENAGNFNTLIKKMESQKANGAFK